VPGHPDEISRTHIGKQADIGAEDISQEIGNENGAQRDNGKAGEQAAPLNQCPLLPVIDSGGKRAEISRSRSNTVDKTKKQKRWD
jgi:hypothetical protein